MRLAGKYKWLLIFPAIFLISYIYFEVRDRDDMDIFLSASRDLLTEKNIYVIRYNDHYHYYYDVLFALALAPFTLIPAVAVKTLWFLLTLFFLYRVWIRIRGLVPQGYLTEKQEMLVQFFSAVFMFRFIHDNLHTAQVTILIVYLMLEGLHLIEKGKEAGGAALIALGICMKLMPLVLLPYLFYRFRIKAAVITVLFAALFLLLPGMVIGHDYNLFLLKQRWESLNPGNTLHVLDATERSFHSLSTLITTLLVKDCGTYYALDIRRNIADIPIETLNIVIQSARMLMIMFTLYFLRSLPFVRERSAAQRLYEISYLCLIIPLIFPHQQHYAFFFIFPAVSYLLFYYYARFADEDVPEKNFRMKKRIFSLLLQLTFLLTSSHLLLGEFNEYYDHFKTLTYGVLLLVVMLATSNPEKLRSPQLNKTIA